MLLAASEARNTIAAACSSGLEIRPIACRYGTSTLGPCASGSAVTEMPVIVAPGAIAFVRMPAVRYMTARDFVSPTMPCFATV
jgi:hypothetical protein